jgi:hypothetical protein
MTLFQLVKITLDALYEEAQKEYGKKADEEISSRFNYLSRSYGDLTNQKRNPVNYQDPATRFAYVYKYVASHGDYVVQILKRVRVNLGTVFKDKKVRVSCIGGGPGSDIIAVLKFLADCGTKEPVEKIVCYLLDREQAWADTWTELDDKLEIDHIKLSVNFQSLDVTKPDSWASQKKFLDADLFTLSYFVSEVYALDNGVVAEFWGTLFKHAKSGALFLYDDNGNDAFNDYFDTQWKAAGLELVDSETNVSWTPSYDEQAAELAAYKAKFGESPKLRGYLSYRILRKP